MPFLPPFQVDRVMRNVRPDNLFNRALHGRENAQGAQEGSSIWIPSDTVKTFTGAIAVVILLILSCVTCKWFSAKRRRRQEWNDLPSETSVPAKHYMTEKCPVEKAESISSFNSLDYEDRLLPPLPFELQDDTEKFVDDDLPQYSSSKSDRKPDLQRPAIARTRDGQAKEKLAATPSTQRLDYGPKPQMTRTKPDQPLEKDKGAETLARIKRKPVPPSQALGQSLPNRPLESLVKELGRSDSLKRQKGTNRKTVVNASSRIANATTQPSVLNTPTLSKIRPPRVVEVVRSFAPALPDELHVRIGDVLRVHEEYKDGWCLVQKAGKFDEKKGVVPQSCIRDRVDFISKHAKVNSPVTTVFADPYRISNNVGQRLRFL